VLIIVFIAKSVMESMEVVLFINLENSQLLKENLE